MADLTGQSVGRYHLIEKLGQGGMATVYKAYDTRLDREVAIKFIRMDIVGEAYANDVLRRFEREAKALARLSHPNIVHVHDYGEYNGAPYLVMEYLGGGTLKARLTGKPIPYKDAARLLTPVAHALAYAHENAIIHRDIKPANILLTTKGQPMLSDFGIAKILDTSDTATLTGTGVGIGTPEYMSPEQGQGKKGIDHRTDIYALGVVFYEMLTGRRPYQADTPVAVVIKHLTEPLPRPRLYVPDLPEFAEYVIYRSMAKAPEDRYQDMALFAHDLEKLAYDTAALPTPATPVPVAVPGQPLAPSVQAPFGQNVVNTRTQVNPTGETAGGTVPVTTQQPPASHVPAAPIRVPEVTQAEHYIPPGSSNIPAAQKPVSRRGFIIGGAIAGVAAVAACGGLVVVGIQQLTKPKPTATAEPTRTPRPTQEQPSATNMPTSVPTAAPTAAPTATQASTTVPTPTEVPATWPRGDVPRNRTLICHNLVGNITPICNPMHPNFNHQFGIAFAMEPIAYYSAHGDKTYLWLAESYTISADCTQFTIQFRKGIQWSDGMPFTAIDVKFSLDKLKAVDGLSRSDTVRNEMVSADLVDDYTLHIKLNQPDGHFFYKVFTYRYDQGDYSTIVPEHIFKDFSDSALKEFSFFDPAKNYPVVTAPYVLAKTDNSIGSYQFDLRPEWWAVKTGFVEKMPDIIRVLMLPIPADENTAAQQVIKDEIDISYSFSITGMRNLLSQTDHMTTWSGREQPYGHVDMWPISIYFNCMLPPFDDPTVRWAVAYAIDQQKVVEEAWGGGKTANSPFPDFSSLNKYMDTISDLTGYSNVLIYDPAKSAAMMVESGYKKNSQGYWADVHGKQLNADLYAATNPFADLAPVVASYLRVAGFACEHKFPDDVWAALADGRAPLFLWGHGGGIMDPVATFEIYLKNNIRPIGEQSWANIGRWSDPKLEALYQEMNAANPEDNKLFDLFHQAMEIWYQELPDVPLCQWYNRAALNTTYWDNYPGKDNPYINTDTNRLTALLLTVNLKKKSN